MIYTFYSYKGGVGRSMALANVAELFYQAGLKVLMIDWDLEAPGLERFFPINHEEVLEKDGIIDLLIKYKQDMAQEISFGEDQGSLPFQNPKDLIFDIHKDPSAKGKLWLLTAGKRSNENFPKYAQSTRAFNWQDFYQNWEGELYFEWLRQQFEEIADVVLIDSRTGVTEMGGVCTYQLADVVVMLCAASQQSLQGTHKMVQDFQRPEVNKVRRRPLDVIVVPARVEDAESDYLDAFQKDFIELFSKYAPSILGLQSDGLWQLSIPYVPRYAYKEVLAIPEQGKAHAQKIVKAFIKLKDTLSLFRPEERRRFFAYDNTWVGREKLIKDLGNRIRNSCRLLVLIGITGVGKTSLGERLAVEMQEWVSNDWKAFHQENFDDEQQASNFTHVAARWLQKWGQPVMPEERNNSQRLLERLVQYLCENRYLVQMDSVENILQGNEEEGWSNFKDEWWLKFFDSYLKAESCESCFILTSQDLPGQIEEAGTKSQNFWHYQLLSGLEKHEQLALFKKMELDVSPDSESRAYLERIGEAYEGHPLALRVITGEIKNKPFEGNVLAYWNKYGSEIEEVEKIIAESQTGKTTGTDDNIQLDRFTKTLKQNVQSRLNKTFNRLKRDSKWAYILLCEASIYRCPVSEDFWLSHLEDWERSKDEQKKAIDSLRSYNLIEEVIHNNQVLVRQHNLIRSLALEHLKHLEDCQ